MSIVGANFVRRANSVVGGNVRVVHDNVTLCSPPFSISLYLVFKK
jgi:hypothetical protein